MSSDAKLLTYISLSILVLSFIASIIGISFSISNIRYGTSLEAIEDKERIQKELDVCCFHDI